MFNNVPTNSTAVGELIYSLRKIVGRRHVKVGALATRSYSTGFRSGGGPVLAVARPANLVEQWRVLQSCYQAGVAIILQASNTGLTGGSTPDGTDYDRPVVIISTTRIRRIHLLNSGRQVVCHSGATLYELEALLAPLNRVPHSVIGSSCIGASIVGGVANNSGGSLVNRGPAYTEMAVFARVTGDGKLELVNKLGMELGAHPEEVLSRLDSGDFDPAAPEDACSACSDGDYREIVRMVNESTPSRFNADPRNLFDASGSAGKVAIFAVRLDTFPAPAEERTYYIGTNDTHILNGLRRTILEELPELPTAAEYMHRDALDIAVDYGKDVFLTIDRLGPAAMPQLFAWKRLIEGVVDLVPGLSTTLVDRTLQMVSKYGPDTMPAKIADFRDQYEHHLIIKIGLDGAESLKDVLNSSLETAGAGSWFECTAEEGRVAFLHRFAVAGAAIRYAAVHGRPEQMIALDIALPRNVGDWFETLPTELASRFDRRLYYGHFLCMVLHQDYVVKAGHDPVGTKEALLALLAERGAEYPAEHNVGHQYSAKPALASFYQTLDPSNTFNPGVGKMSKRRWYN